MRLKSLEIKGFKSFADKTIVNFDENITGIVGPNGCGKSNIIDSIRWVIGEQKISQLRSENLDSLVFNGSKTRSASGLAEVSLTFENTRNLLPTEFNTVTVTRKFYKSGESEYRLNDVSCRLKDIQNLFMDTGVSTDSYAIIELGMVDDIIKDKENSRRKMLEQAAGITIYKTRKREAKLKLDATELDLARIEDLLFEIYNQLKSLENQAKKAEKYYEIKKEYRVLSIELAKAALEGFNLSFKELQHQNDQESDKKLRLEAEISNEDAELEKQKLEFIEKERVLQGLQKEYNELVQTIKSRENDKNLASQKLNFLREREQSIQEFLEKSDGQLKGLEESISFTEMQIQEEAAKLDGLQEQLNTLKDSVDERKIIFDQKRMHIDKFRSDYAAIQRKQFEAEKKVVVADTSVQNLQLTIQRLEEESVARKSQIRQIEEERTEKEQELESKKAKLNTLREEHEQTKERILQTQSALEKLRQELAEEGRKLDSRKNEHALLKSLIDSMEGYPDSVKFLHNNQQWNNNAPILSDIIYVKEEYRAAVENVLEPYLNYYIVNNLQEGLQAVRLLDENKKGKANFFLLDQVSTNVHSGSHQPAETIAAMDVIEVDEKFRPLAEYLLGNVFIAENDLVLQDSNGAVLLDKEGKFYKGKYFLTGGSVGIFEGNKIGRVKNLEKLQARIAEQEEVVEKLKIVISEKQEEVILYNDQLQEDEIKRAQEEINSLTNQVYSLVNKLENVAGSQESSEKQIEELQMKLEETLAEIEEPKSELTILLNRLSELQTQLSEAEEDYKDSEREFNDVQASYNEFNLQVTRQQSKIAAVQQEMSFKQNQIAELKTQIESNLSQLKITSENIAESENLLENAESGLLDLIRKREEDQKTLNESDRQYHIFRNELTEKESKLRQKIKEKEIIEHLLAEIKDKLNELRLSLAGMKERLHVEFKVNLDDILEEARTGEETVEVLQEKSERMKKRLDNLGEVNPTAIEAYQEMKKRYEFILEQKNDLVTAKDSLLQTIQEVEATANQQFLDTFNKVRDNFQKVFKALFTEDDTADMVLVNPENLAETGIDIIAKPKGKRPSSITQLSGGEKTLTATALLFAIYLIKPAPFCILDEVDAPLDDANVGKFTNMIRQFSADSQFIIVTHNKMTMNAVDVIYGVTMQEPGVSKLVPVDFRSLN